MNSYRYSSWTLSKFAALTFFSGIILILSAGCGSPMGELLSDLEKSDEETTLTCSAGENQIGTALGQTITLSGSISDEDTSATYTWEPSAANPTSVDLTDSNTRAASFTITPDLAEGDYTFTLSVNDGKTTDSDSVSVSIHYREDLSVSGDSISLSADGTTALIGDSRDSGNGSYAGAAYIYTKTSTGWEQNAKLLPSDGFTKDRFGCSVSISADGNTALIGAMGDDSINETYDVDRAGAAYIFTRSGATWVQAAKLTTTDRETDAELGCAVSLSGDGKTALVGALSINSNRGAAYIFQSSSWSDCTETAELTAFDRAPDDGLGFSVSLSADGQTALIGTGHLEDGRGKAYIFTSSLWTDCTETAKLTASDGSPFDGFGYSVSLSADGSTALVGKGDSTASRNGGAYLYSPSSWSDCTETVKLPETAKGYGLSVSLSSDGSTAIVGSNKEDLAYIYTGSSSNWTQKAKIPLTGEMNFEPSLAELSSDGSTAILGTRFSDLTVYSLK